MRSVTRIEIALPPAGARNDKIFTVILVLCVLNLLIAAPEAGAKNSPYVETIRQFFLKGEYDRVIEQMPTLNLDENSSEMMEGLYFVGVSLIKVGRYADGRDVLSRIAQRKPKIKFRDQVELRIADAFLAESALNIALKRYQNVMTAYPDSSGLARAYEQSALICQRLGQFEQAQSYFKLLQMNCPLSFEAANLRRGITERISHFGVQMGTFANLFNAEHLKTELETKGFQPYVQTVREDAEPLYRVLIGEFASKQEAETAAQNLESLGYPAQVYP
ncbi:MAG: SPOR domain-containing protein [Candidatus Omnitrophica bacterium]|nr:SPOR domain-containing protein [Candidatus Omnitrophota bacterium]